jgi:hypothetical protein
MGSAVGFAPCSTRLRLVCLWIPVVRCGGGMFDVAASESSGSAAATATATAAVATADDDDDAVAVRCTIRFILFSPFFGWLSRCPLLVLLLLLPPLDLLDSAQSRIHCDFRVGVLVLQLVMMLLQLPTKAVVVVVVVSRP